MSEISILNRSRSWIPPQRRFRALLSSLCATLEIPNPGLEIVFLNDHQIRPYYRRYFGADRATDVIAFPMENPELLGCLVISVETARRQAREQRHNLWEELRRLIIHGLLHLLGYDHAAPAEAKKMRAQEEDLLRRTS